MNKKQTKSISDEIVAQSKALLVADREKDIVRMKMIGRSLNALLEKAYWTHPEILWLPHVRAANAVVRRLKKALYIQRPRPVELSGGAYGMGRRR